MNWTDAQRRSIESRLGTTLVSAAAGSGKTAVLAERCARLVFDADSPCDVDQLLVLTFTRAAAAEMRARIGRAIRQRAAGDDSARVQRQLRLLDRASITTLDSFCISLVRDHFDLVGIDPAFRILDDDEARLMQLDAAGAVIEAAVSSDIGQAVRELILFNFNGRDSSLAAEIIQLRAMARSLPDADGWLERAITLHESPPGFDHPFFAELIHSIAFSQSRLLSEHADLMQESAKENSDVSVYADTCRARYEAMQAIHSAVAERDLSALCEAAKAYFATEMKRVSGKARTPEVAAFAERIKAARDAAEPALKYFSTWTSDELADGLRNAAPRVRLIIDLVRRFEAEYDRRKRSLGAIDFVDAETLALRILGGSVETPSDAARRLHVSFRHVLVDEFQDINPLQDTIIRLASTDAVSRIEPHVRSNLFCVGDVKQSIYGFRLAEPRQFVNLATELRTAHADRGRLIDLQQNFRSRSGVIDAVNETFRRIMSADVAQIDYDATHELIADARVFAGHPQPTAPAELHVLSMKADESESESDEQDDGDDLDQIEREGAFIAARIRALTGQTDEPPAVVAARGPDGQNVSRPAAAGDIAVLLRAQKYKAGLLAGVLRRAGIPVHAADSSGFFDSTEVLDALSLLRAIDNRRDDFALAALLRAPWIGDPADAEADLLRIRMAFPGLPFHLAVERHAKAGSDSAAVRARAVFDLLDESLVVFRERTLEVAIRDRLERTGLRLFAAGLPDGAQRLANLETILEWAGRYASFDRPTLHGFLRFVDDLQEHSTRMPARPATGENAVRIMTVHASKGLEFPIVFVPDLGRRFNFHSSTIPSDRVLSFGVEAIDPARQVRWETAATHSIKVRRKRDERAEEMRVLYVAMTRARERLILVGSTRRHTPAQIQSGERLLSITNGRLDANLGGNVLDWLVPVARDVPNAISLVVHDAGSIRSMLETKTRTKKRPGNARLKAFEPITVAPAPRPAAIERLEFSYPHADAAHSPATLAVTALAHAMAPDQLGPSPAAHAGSAEGQQLGDAVHALLRRIDFRSDRTIEAIRSRAADLVERDLIDAEIVSKIDFDSIAWLIDGPIGERARSAGRVFQEFALSALDDSPPTAADAVLLRGRIDLLCVDDQSADIIDFKTDRVDGERLAARIEMYSEQIRAYAAVVARLLPGRTVRGRLAFLHPRRIVEVE